MIRAALEEKSASEICAHVLRHYVGFENKPPIHIRRAPEGSLHSVFLEKTTWAELMGCRVTERRPISAILEQQLRAYLSLPLPNEGADSQQDH
ncbi:MAG: hypothetical protein ACE5EY_00775 [Anaerolineae bacterium]